jgi:hypothetical protein
VFVVVDPQRSHKWCLCIWSISIPRFKCVALVVDWFLGGFYIERLIIFHVFSRAKELIMNIVQQRSRTEGAGSSMGEISMGGGPGNHAHVSVTLLHNIEKIQSMSFENVFILVPNVALSADIHRL